MGIRNATDRYRHPQRRNAVVSARLHVPWFAAKFVSGEIRNYATKSTIVFH